MRRREFITFLGGAVMWPSAARAQQSGGMQLIGVLQSLAADDPDGKARFAAFQQALQQLGWTAGRNVQFALAVLLAIVMATDGHPLAVIAVVLVAIFLTGRLTR
jgi:phosphotransferase system  glucose/maltose/N-acetylglucosamine-specific IIC component